MKSDLLDFVLVEHHRTDAAILLSDTGERDDAFWVPLEAVELEQNGQHIIVTMREQLALDKGLI